MLKRLTRIGSATIVAAVIGIAGPGSAIASHGADDPVGHHHGHHHEAGDDHGLHNGHHHHHHGHHHGGNDDGPNHT